MAEYKIETSDDWSGMPTRKTKTSSWSESDWNSSQFLHAHPRPVKISEFMNRHRPKTVYRNQHLATLTPPEIESHLINSFIQPKLELHECLESSNSVVQKFLDISQDGWRWNSVKVIWLKFWTSRGCRGIELTSVNLKGICSVGNSFATRLHERIVCKSLTQVGAEVLLVLSWYLAI